MSKLLCLLVFLMIGLQIANAQIGINTLDPNPSSALDIRSITKGLLIPSMNSQNRLNISNPADGLMVYDTDLKMFLFWNKASSKWESLNPWNYKPTDADGNTYNLYTLLNANVGIGRLDPQQKLHVAGSVKIDSSLYVTQNATVTGNINTTNITATTITGNGAGISNVNAATLGSQPSSYFGKASDVSDLQTNKADKTDLFSTSKPVTVSASTYCGTFCSVTNSNVVYTKVGNMVFVSGFIVFNNSSPYKYICASLSNLPDFPSVSGTPSPWNTGAATIYKYSTVNMIGLLGFSNAPGYGNMITFTLNNDANFDAANYLFKFQFFYSIQ